MIVGKFTLIVYIKKILSLKEINNVYNRFLPTLENNCQLKIPIRTTNFRPDTRRHQTRSRGTFL